MVIVLDFIYTMVMIPYSLVCPVFPFVQFYSRYILVDRRFSPSIGVFASRPTPIGCLRGPAVVNVPYFLPQAASLTRGADGVPGKLVSGV